MAPNSIRSIVSTLARPSIAKRKTSIPAVQAARRSSRKLRRSARANLLANHPLGHMGEPIDVAYGILYLASEESRFMTGSELVIDGGWTAH